MRYAVRGVVTPSLLCVTNCTGAVLCCMLRSLASLITPIIESEEDGSNPWIIHSVNPK